MENRRTDRVVKEPRDRAPTPETGRKGLDSQALVVSALSLGRFRPPRGGARPIDLERRARFARFDGA